MMKALIAFVLFLAGISVSAQSIDPRQREREGLRPMACETYEEGCDRNGSDGTYNDGDGHDDHEPYDYERRDNRDNPDSVDDSVDYHESEDPLPF